VSSIFLKAHPRWLSVDGSLLTPFPPHVLGIALQQIGAYAQILSADPNMTQMVSFGGLLVQRRHCYTPLTCFPNLQDPYISDLLKQPGDRPVFQVALMPSEGLANVTQEVAERVADKMASINAQGITVWL
jgi:hypothetical protein